MSRIVVGLLDLRESTGDELPGNGDEGVRGDPEAEWGSG